MLTKYSDVDGWFSDEDAAEYLRIVQTIPNGGLLVEVGTWLGRSLFSISDECRKRGIRMAVVDTWQGSEEHRDIDTRDLYGRFLGNLIERGLLGLVTPIRLPSLSAAKLIREAGSKPDLVFIDASHDYENVKADILAWSDVGLSLAGHDYSPGLCGVPRAVDECYPSAIKQIGGSSIWWQAKIDLALSH